MKKKEIRNSITILNTILTTRSNNTAKQNCLKALQNLFEKAQIKNFKNFLISEGNKNLKLTNLEESLINGQYEFDAEEKKETVKSKRLNKTIYRSRIFGKNCPFYENDDHLRHYSKILSVTGHIAPITCILVVDDFFITAGEDKIIKIWDLKTGMLVRSMIQHKAIINDICVSVDNRYLASTDANGALIVWCLSTFQPIYEIEMHSSIELVEFIGRDNNKEKTHHFYEKIHQNGEKNTLTNNNDCKKDVLSQSSEQLEYSQKPNNSKNNEYLANNDEAKKPENVPCKDDISQSNEKLSQNIEINKPVHDKKNTESSKPINTYSIVAVLNKGNVNTITFDSQSIIEERSNSIMSFLGDETSIRAICISEGGRFLLCGGMWPFVLLFNTLNLENNICTLDTDGYSIFGLCASINKPRFCASTGFNFLFEWEYFEHGKATNNIFKKSSSTLKGYWNRRIIYICENENVQCYRLIYLCNDIAICSCSDNTIRIIDYNILEIQVNEVGILLSHPKHNVFAVSGVFNDKPVIKTNSGWKIFPVEKDEFCDENIDYKKYFKSKEIKFIEHNTIQQECVDLNTNIERHCLRLYNQKGDVLYEYQLLHRLTDAYFSSDGNFLCLGDEMGYSHIFSIYELEDKMINVPKEQFFLCDLDFLFDFEIQNDDFVQTYNLKKEKNEKKNIKEILIKSQKEKQNKFNYHYEIEKYAMEHIESSFMTFDRFKQKYIVDDKNTCYEQINVPDETDRPNVSTDSEESLISFADSESSEKNSNEVGINKRKAALDAQELYSVNFNTDDIIEKKIKDNRKEKKIKDNRKEKKKRGKKRKESKIMSENNEKRNIITFFESLNDYNTNRIRKAALNVQKRRKLLFDDSSENHKEEQNNNFPPRRNAVSYDSLFIRNDSEEIDKPSFSRKASKRSEESRENVIKQKDNKCFFPPRRQNLKNKSSSFLSDSSEKQKSDCNVNKKNIEQDIQINKDQVVNTSNTKFLKQRKSLYPDCLNESNNTSFFPPRRKIVIRNSNDSFHLSDRKNMGSSFPPRRNSTRVYIDWEAEDDLDEKIENKRIIKICDSSESPYKKKKRKI